MAAARCSNSVKSKPIYAQGDPSDALYYLASGAVKVTIISEFGKEAVIAILSAGDFFGEGVLEASLTENSTIVDDD